MHRLHEGPGVKIEVDGQWLVYVLEKPRLGKGAESQMTALWKKERIFIHWIARIQQIQIRELFFHLTFYTGVPLARKAKILT